MEEAAAVVELAVVVDLEVLATVQVLQGSGRWAERSEVGGGVVEAVSTAVETRAMAGLALVENLVEGEREMPVVVWMDVAVGLQGRNNQDIRRS
mmetsp:Transcript_517/g.1356  ORF Transcript_517/g.1356 Transcript_517/m.1356 type:complete len:94 (-) Transcript_517:441-722(-)